MAIQKAVRVVTLDDSKIKDNFKNLEVQTVDIPEPQDGQVLVRIKLRPVNPTDLISAAGRYPGTQVPFTPGSEGMGIVEKNGPGAGKFQAGQRVVVAAFPNSTWQQYAAVAESDLYPVPDNVDDKTAAQFFINPLTVVGMLEVSAVPKGKYILQGAAGSVLGRQLVQYAKHLGIRSINIVRRQEQIQELKDLGADEVIDSSKEDVEARVKEITGGEGAWAALDPVGGNFTRILLKSVRAGGYVRIYGALGGDDLHLKLMDVLLADQYLTGFIWVKWLNGNGADKRRERMDYTMQLLADGVITPLLGRSYQLENVHEAVAASQQAGRGAKVFLEG